MQLEHIVMTQEDNSFASISQRRLARYREMTPLWVRYSASTADKLGPKPRLDMTIVNDIYNSYHTDTTEEHFLKVVDPDTPKSAMIRRYAPSEPIPKKPVTTTKDRQIRGSKIRKIEDSFF